MNMKFCNKWILSVMIVMSAFAMASCGTQVESPMESTESLTEAFWESEMDTVPSIEEQTEEITKEETLAAEVSYNPESPIPFDEVNWDAFQAILSDEDYEALGMYQGVLSENEAFLLSNYMSPFDELAEYTFEMLKADSAAIKEDEKVELQVETIQIWDIDDDDQKELILNLYDVVPFTIVLHYENGVVYGFWRNLRGFETVQTNGIYVGADGGGSQSYMQLVFEEGYREVVLAVNDWGECSIGGESVEQETFDQWYEENMPGEIERIMPSR